jgi:proteasome accessory factor A
MQTLATTEKWNRGLLNSRREAHGTPLERLHLIGFDYTILASALLASLVGCALAAAEEGFCGLNLYDPVDALRRWSWSLDRTNGRLPATALLIDGRHLTLPEYIRELATTLLEMREDRLLTERIAPKAESLLPKIIDLTHYVEEGSLHRASVHLDWAAKLLYLMQGDGPYGDAAMRLADHDFANTDPGRGPIWRLWEGGLVDPLVTMDDVRACLRDPPPESRDWGRGRVIERFAAEIAAIDWSHIDLYRDGPWNYPQRKMINLPQLDSFNQRQFQHLIDAAGDVEGLLDLLEKEASQVHAPNVPRENP